MNGQKGKYQWFPVLNFNCLPTLASELTTCFTGTLTFIRQLKLSDSPPSANVTISSIFTWHYSVSPRRPPPRWLMRYQVSDVVTSHVQHSTEQSAPVLLTSITFFKFTVCLFNTKKDKIGIDIFCWYRLYYMNVLKVEQVSQKQVAHSTVQ